MSPNRASILSPTHLDGAAHAQVLPQLQAVDEVKHLSEAKPSFARVRYSEQCEAAINEQINVEYTISVRK